MPRLQSAGSNFVEKEAELGQESIRLGYVRRVREKKREEGQEGFTNRILVG